MTPSHASSRSAVDEYFSQLSQGLRGVPPSEADDFLRELRAHVDERLHAAGSGADPAEILRQLGSPKVLAASYRVEMAASLAARSRSPLQLLGSLLRWARLSAGGVVIFGVVATGYVIATSLFLAALMKPFRPGAGLWLIDEDTVSLRISPDSSHPGIVGARELLGWWIIPIGLVAGTAVVFATGALGRYGAALAGRPRWIRRRTLEQ